MSCVIFLVCSQKFHTHKAIIGLVILTMLREYNASLNMLGGTVDYPPKWALARFDVSSNWQTCWVKRLNPTLCGAELYDSIFLHVG